jgi:hypothetical protein
MVNVHPLAVYICMECNKEYDTYITSIACCFGRINCRTLYKCTECGTLYLMYNPAHKCCEKVK